MLTWLTQDEQEDVSVLCQTEMQNLQGQTKRSEDEVLRAVAKVGVPPTLVSLVRSDQRPILT